MQIKLCLFLLVFVSLVIAESCFECRQKLAKIEQEESDAIKQRGSALGLSVQKSRQAARCNEICYQEERQQYYRQQQEERQEEEYQQQYDRQQRYNENQMQNNYMQQQSEMYNQQYRRQNQNNYRSSLNSQQTQVYDQMRKILLDLMDYQKTDCIKHSVKYRQDNPRFNNEVQLCIVDKLMNTTLNGNKEAFINLMNRLEVPVEYWDVANTAIINVARDLSALTY